MKPKTLSKIGLIICALATVFGVYRQDPIIILTGLLIGFVQIMTILFESDLWNSVTIDGKKYYAVGYEPEVKSGIKDGSES